MGTVTESSCVCSWKGLLATWLIHPTLRSSTLKGLRASVIRLGSLGGQLRTMAAYLMLSCPSAPLQA